MKQQANQSIAAKCRAISENLLIDINSKKVYEELQFKDEQLEHKERIAQKLYDLYHGITIIMRQQFVVFQKDGSEVYRHWVKLGCTQYCVFSNPVFFITGL